MWGTHAPRLISAASLLLFALPCRADVAPESGLLVHVQPVSSGSEWCSSSSISSCTQIVRTTMQDGEFEFVLFFMTGAMGSGCLQSLHTVLTWPPAWQLKSFDACAAWDGYLDAGGPTHELYLEWEGYPIGSAYGAVVPVARLVMNVVGSGRLGFATNANGEAVLRHNCSSPTFVTHPVQVYAEAGVQCGHLTAQCGYYTVCEPVFYAPELTLRAPAGDTVDSTFSFLVAAYWQTCSLVADPHAPWCTASVELPPIGNWQLHVTADATGLLPGTYETAIEVISSSYGVSRCLPTTFIVEGSTATSTSSWGRVKSLYR